MDKIHNFLFLIFQKFPVPFRFHIETNQRFRIGGAQIETPVIVLYTYAVNQIYPTGTFSIFFFHLFQNKITVLDRKSVV